MAFLGFLRRVQRLQSMVNTFSRSPVCPYPSLQICPTPNGFRYALICSKHWPLVSPNTYDSSFEVTLCGSYHDLEPAIAAITANTQLHVARNYLRAHCCSRVLLCCFLKRKPWKTCQMPLSPLHVAQLVTQLTMKRLPEVFGFLPGSSQQMPDALVRS